MEQKLNEKQEVQTSLDSPWKDLALLSDFMSKELVKKLDWHDIKVLMAVNRTWQSLFSADVIWKPLFEEQYPFQADKYTTNYCTAFKHIYDLSNGIRCQHKDASHEGAERICPCVFKYFLTEHQKKLGVARRFTGIKSEYYHCFPTWEDCECCEKPTDDKTYRTYPVVCKACMDVVIHDSYVCQHIGMPEKQVQRLDAEWIHEEFVSPQKLETIRSIPGSDKYLAIIKDPHQIVQVTFKEKKQVHIEPLLQEDEIAQLLVLQKKEKVSGDQEEDHSDDDDDIPNNNNEAQNTKQKLDCIEISPCGKYAAIYQHSKTQGIVYNLIDRRVTFKLLRGSYHVRSSSFPIAFFIHEGKTLLIAGKDWNYLEVYDPETGEALRTRDVSENHLELFWCSLEVSPDQKSACSFGWVWHPVGMVASFSIEDWMTKDIYASENAKIGLDSEMWDTSFCFVDNDTMALWTETTLPSKENEVEEKTSYGIMVKRQKKSDIVLGYNIKTRHFTRLALPEVSGYSLMMDGDYLYHLDPHGIQVVDPKKNLFFEIKNWLPVKMERMWGFNKNTKQFLSSFKPTENEITYVLSHIKW